MTYKAWVKRNDPCVYCGELPKEQTYTLDHVIPVACGGKDKNNLAVACFGCNRRKGTQLPLAFLVENRHKQLARPVAGCACGACVSSERVQ